jgi:hypothetical protein
MVKKLVKRGENYGRSAVNGNSLSACYTFGNREYSGNLRPA